MYPSSRLYRRRCLNPWLAVQDLIGPKENWPSFIPNYMWCGPLDYKDRVVIASFFYQNGVSAEFLIEVLEFVNKQRLTVKRAAKILELYKYWSDPIEGFARRTRYFAFDLVVRKVLDLNGRVRTSDNYQEIPRGLERPAIKYYRCRK